MNVTESNGTCKPHFVVHGGVGEPWSSQGDIFCVSPPLQGMVGGLIHKDHVAICITLTQIALCYSFRWDLLSIAYISTVKTWNNSWLTYLSEIYQGPVYSLWSLSKSNSTSLCFQREELGHQWRVLGCSWGLPKWIWFRRQSTVNAHRFVEKWVKCLLKTSDCEAHTLWLNGQSMGINCI